MGEATRGPELSEVEHEVTLHEERPVVEKETVPVERVRLTKDTVTEEAQVSDEISKEQIEAEGRCRDLTAQDGEVARAPQCGRRVHLASGCQRAAGRRGRTGSDGSTRRWCTTKSLGTPVSW